jgi:hypothetical protein
MLGTTMRTIDTLERLGLALLLAPAFCGSLACSSTQYTAFDNPEDAMRAVAELASISNPVRAEAVFGDSGVALLKSGDPVADRADAQRVLHAIREKVVFEDRDANTKVALLGKDGWPFPIPLVSDEHGWRFDAEAGRVELEKRRIGRNELTTLAVLHEYVYAQREYRSTAHDGRPPAYAGKLISSEGAHDGLYWPVAQAEPASPLGPLIAAAAREGQARDQGQLTPFHGYYFRILAAQGQRAPGGEKNYVDEHGLMTGGCALLAWPAQYGESGVMTFQISAHGLVFQRDLGPSTEAAAARIRRFDPDDTWSPTSD